MFAYPNMNVGTRPEAALETIFSFLEDGVFRVIE
jgi:hypothetical protein